MKSEENDVHIHTALRSIIAPTDQRLLFVLVEPEDRTRPLQSTGLISELARCRLSYGTPYAWVDILIRRTGVTTTCLHLWLCDTDSISVYCKQVKTIWVFMCPKKTSQDTPLLLYCPAPFPLSVFPLHKAAIHHLSWLNKATKGWLTSDLSLHLLFPYAWPLSFSCSSTISQNPVTLK